MIVQKQPPLVFCKKGVLKIFASFTGKHLCWSLFLIKLHAFRLQLYSKKTPAQAFSSEIRNNFRNTYFKENMWTTTFEYYYNKDCFLGTVKSDRKKKKIFYPWYDNFKPFGCGWFWIVVGSFGWFWVVVVGFGWSWVVLAGFGWL